MPITYINQQPNTSQLQLKMQNSICLLRRTECNREERRRHNTVTYISMVEEDEMHARYVYAEL